MQKEWDATYGYAPVSLSISANFPRKSKNFKKLFGKLEFSRHFFIYTRNDVTMTSLFQHKTPSGAFDPEVFAAPSTHSTSITELPLSSQNMVPGHELHRTESLGLKCLSDKPLLVSQIRNGSTQIFSLLRSATYQNHLKHGFCI